MATKQPPRKPVPPEIERAVLTKSRRRCTLCFHLDQDTRQKKGQIAHLDRRRTNDTEDNLVFLCLDHHSEYDSTTSQHKNYTIEEVKHFRDRLYRWVKGGMLSVFPRHAKTRGATPNRPQETAFAIMPPKAPQVTPTFYGRSADGYEGLHLNNEGAPAYDLHIDPIELPEGWGVRFDELSRLDSSGVCRSWVSRGHTGMMELYGILREVDDFPPILPLVIHYKDFHGRRYKSICELHRDVMKKYGFDVKFIRQESTAGPS